MARLLIAVLLVTTSLPVMALAIAQQGEPVVVIALPDKPGGPETEAASELTAYLGKLTGGVFEQVARVFLGALWLCGEPGSRAERSRPGGTACRTGSAARLPRGGLPPA